jgi:hypothetical protein
MHFESLPYDHSSGIYLKKYHWGINQVRALCPWGTILVFTVLKKVLKRYRMAIKRFKRHKKVMNFLLKYGIYTISLKKKIF